MGGKRVDGGAGEALAFAQGVLEVAAGGDVVGDAEEQLPAFVPEHLQVDLDGVGGAVGAAVACLEGEERDLGAAQRGHQVGQFRRVEVGDEIERSQLVQVLGRVAEALGGAAVDVAAAEGLGVEQVDLVATGPDGRGEQAAVGLGQSVGGDVRHGVDGSGEAAVGIEDGIDHDLEPPLVAGELGDGALEGAGRLLHGTIVGGGGDAVDDLPAMAADHRFNPAVQQLGGGAVGVGDAALAVEYPDGVADGVERGLPLCGGMGEAGGGEVLGGEIADHHAGAGAAGGVGEETAGALALEAGAVGAQVGEGAAAAAVFGALGQQGGEARVVGVDQAGATDAADLLLGAAEKAAGGGVGGKDGAVGFGKEDGGVEILENRAMAFPAFTQGGLGGGAFADLSPKAALGAVEEFAQGGGDGGAEEEGGEGEAVGGAERAVWQGEDDEQGGERAGQGAGGQAAVEGGEHDRGIEHGEVQSAVGLAQDAVADEGGGGDHEGGDEQAPPERAFGVEPERRVTRGGAAGGRGRGRGGAERGTMVFGQGHGGRWDRGTGTRLGAVPGRARARGSGRWSRHYGCAG